MEFIAAQAEEQVLVKIDEGVYTFTAGCATCLHDEAVSDTRDYCAILLIY